MSTPKLIADACIVGSGIVGCAIALELQQRGLKVLVLDSNPRPGMGTTSRNSEVIHAGIYYPTGSLKARLCVEGRRLFYDFAAKHEINYRKIGKLIVSTSSEQDADLEALYKKGLENDVEGLSFVEEEELKAQEPEVFAKRAILSAESGIVSAHDFCNALAALGSAEGVQFAYLTALEGLAFESNSWRITTDTVRNGMKVGDPFSAHVKSVINCAGLYGDRVAELAGIDVDSAGYRLHWVKGNYFSLSARWGKLLKHLIYPLPEKNLRGLGIHVTLDVGGQARLGPNTEEIEKREDYQVNASFQPAFFEAAKRYLPALEETELSPGMAGIRPKLSKAGEAARDFVISEESSRGLPGLVNLLGIESPGLTSSLAIARYVAQWF